MKNASHRSTVSLLCRVTYARSELTMLKGEERNEIKLVRCPKDTSRKRGLFSVPSCAHSDHRRLLQSNSDVDARRTRLRSPAIGHIDSTTSKEIKSLTHSHTSALAPK